MKRVLLKLSGEALAGEQKRGFDEATVTAVSYTHLDVYQRQVHKCTFSGKGL